jgi:ABC-type lipoprotein release transport system permease subunit
MTLTRMVFASLRYHWRMHLAVCCGVVVATAVLTGSLLVGDSMRGSLRDLTLDRLGRVDSVLPAPRFFREKLAHETAARVEFKEYFSQAVPAILTRATLSNPGKNGRPTGTRSSGVSVIGCDGPFWRMCDAADDTLPRGRKVAIGRALADELGVSVGDAVILRLPRPGVIPADTMLGKKNGTVKSHRMAVAAVLDENGHGGGPVRFALRPSQIHPRNVCVSLDWLQKALERPGKANTILVAADKSKNDEPIDSRAVLQRVLRPSLDDYGIRIERSELGYCNITSDRMIISPEAERAIVDSLADYEVRPVLAYLANTISCRGRTVPYSTVAAIDFGKGNFGKKFVDAASHPIAALAADEIVLNEWTAGQLGAKAGDSVVLEFFEPRSDGGSYKERRQTFRLAAVMAMRGAAGNRDAGDRDLVPKVAGITDESTMADWDPPFPFDAGRIGDEDEAYWKTYGPTPKAFVSLAEGRRLWASRFGQTTSLRVFSKHLGETVTVENVRRRLRFDAAAMGFAFQPVKQIGLDASRGATSFQALFIGFSFFIATAAVLLVGLLFRLGIDNRAAELGILAALGLRRSRIVWTFLAEGLVVAALGGLLGTAAGAVYAKLMLDGLNTLWVAAIVVPFLQLHVTYASLAIGAAAGTATAAVAIVLSVWRIGLRWPRRLMAGQIHDTGPDIQPQKDAKDGSFLFGSRAIPAAIVVVGILAALLLGGVGEEFRAGTFFAAGTAVLMVALLLVWKLLKRCAAGRLVVAGGGNIRRLALAGAARHPGRSTLAMGLMAAAFFLIVAVGAFRREPLGEKPRLKSANGGFSLYVQTEMPVYHGLGSEAGRENMGFSREELLLLNRCKIFSLRTQRGDDASCLNLYRPGQPTVLGLPGTLIERGGFAWDAGGWEDLRQANREKVPVVLERNTAKYALHVGGVGTRFAIAGGKVSGTICRNGPEGAAHKWCLTPFPHDEQGRPVELEIVGLLAASLFQGDLLVDERAFKKLFPDTSGYGVFLVDVPAGDTYRRDVAAVQTALQRVLEDYGATVETTGGRLARLAVVQNTYLSTFQSLGGLGLLLGTFGLAAVLMRNMVERRAELALLAAVGFRRKTLARMVAYENGILLLGGLGCGVVAAITAVLPQLVSGQAVVPWGRLLATVAGVMALGLPAGMVAFRLVVSSPLMNVLRRE